MIELELIDCIIIKSIHMHTRKLFLLSIIFILSFGNKNVAQENQSGKSQKKEIIIRQGSDSTQKMVVIVNGDKVTVNGKEYTGDAKNEFIIKRRKNGLTAPDVFIMEEEPAIFEFEENDEIGQASLGILAGKDDKGAVILEVLPGSAADKAGLKQHDVIVSISGKKITGPEELSETIKIKKPTDKVEIVYLREGKTKSTSALLETRKSLSKSLTLQSPRSRNREIFIEEMIENGVEENQHPADMRNPHARLGLEIQETEDETGVRIIDVASASAGEKSGLKNGDIVLSIDEQKINSVADARSATSQNKRVLNFNILRDGKAIFLEVKIPKILKKATL
jgi:serine protease Do